MLKIDKYDRKYLFAILSLAVFLLLVVTVIVIYNQIAAIKRTQARELKMIADFKASQMENLRSHFTRNGEEILDEDSLRHFLLDSKTGKLKEEFNTVRLHKFAVELTGRYNLKGFKVFSPGGELRFTMLPDRFAEDEYKYKFFSDNRDIHLPELAEFHLGSDNDPHLSLIIPLHFHQSRNAQTVGYIFAKIDPEHTFYPLLNSWPYESSTSEALLAASENDSIVYLNELRHIKNSAVKLKVPVSDTGIVVVKAFRGAGGFVEAKDYRGIPVLAYARKIDGSNWMLVVKTDRSELMQPIYSRIIFSVSFSGVLMSLFIFGFMFVYRKEKGRLYESLYREEQEKNALLKQYDFMIRNSNDIILIVDKSGLISEINEKALMTYGYDRVEMIGAPVELIRGNGGLPTTAEVMKELEIKEGMIFETIHARKDGTKFPVEVSAKLLRIGGVNYFQSIVRDITERKFHEEKIHRLNRMLNMLSASNKAIVRKANREELFREIIRVAIQIGKFAGVWIGAIDESDSEVIFNESGKSGLGGYILRKILRKNPEFRESGKKSGTFYCNEMGADPECKEINLHEGVSEISSFAVFRIVNAGGKPFYILLLCDTPGLFTEAEQGLLDEMAEDISYAISFYEMENSYNISEAKFKTMVEESPVGIFIMDEFGRITYGNPALEEIMGSTKKALNGYNWLRAIHPDDRPLIVSKWSRAVEERVIFNADGRFINESGKITYWRAKSAPVKTADSVIGHVGMIFDDTEIMEKQFEIVKLFTAIQQTDSAVMITTLDSTIEYVNPAFEKLTGYLGEEIYGKNPSILQSGLTPRDLYYEMYSNIARGETWRGEFINRKKNGEIYYESAVITPVKDFTGKPVNFLAIKDDITEKKTFQRELEEKNRLIEQVLQLLPVGVWLLDEKGNIVQGNEMAVKIWEGAKYIGMSDYGIYSARWYKTGKEIKPEEWAATRVIKNREISIKEEIEIDCFDGSKKVIYNSAVPIISADNKLLGAIVVNEDITEIKRSESELIMAKERAEEMNRLKSNFLANMSHELRTPLIGILGFSEILSDPEFPEEVQKMAGTINGGGTRLLETLNLILDLSRLEAGRLDVKNEYVDIIKTTTEAIDGFKALALQKKLSLRLNTQYRRMKIKSDERLLVSILNNLINNAIKFTYNGGVTVSVSACINQAGLPQSVKLSVADTGIGISEEDQKIIFEEFRQASEGHSRGFEGTGLGLTITLRFVEKLGGKISLQSLEGSGSIFTVELPAEFDDYEEAGDYKTGSVLIGESLLENKQKILFVENDSLNSEVIMKFLFGAYEVDHTSTGTEAILRGTTRKYDAILMDINLGGKINGLMAAQKIREEEFNKDTPIIAITAYAAPSNREHFLASGCTHYLAKPFRRKDIINLLEDIFSGVK